MPKTRKKGTSKGDDMSEEEILKELGKDPEVKKDIEEIKKDTKKQGKGKKCKSDKTDEKELESEQSSSEDEDPEQN